MGRDLTAMARRRRALRALRRVTAAVATDLAQSSDAKAPSPLANRPRSCPPTRAA